MTTHFPLRAAAIPPWEMWGSSITSEILAPAPGAAGALIAPPAVQLFKVQYRRPETWSFFFAGQLIDGNVSDVDIQIIAQLHIIPGVGRTMFDTQGAFGASTAFVEFRWRVLAGIQPGIGNTRKWATQTTSPLYDDMTPGSTQPVQWFPAQDIQGYTRTALILTGASAVDNRVLVQITGWVAPRTHVRPDWYSEDFQEQFLGAETGGT